MEKKNFTKIEISVIKSAAKNAAPFVAKKQKVEEQIKDVEEVIRKRISEKLEKLEAEKASYQSIIDSLNESVKRITGGYTSEDLIAIEKVGTGKIDEKTGKEIMQTRYNLKYPDTVVPPTTEESPGSDYDADVECTSHGDVYEEEMPEELLEEEAKVAEAAANEPFDWQ